MSDVIVFFMGCFVSLMVLGAVGLLLWGAANEPRGRLLPRGHVQPPKPRSRPESRAPETAPSLEPEHVT